MFVLAKGNLGLHSEDAAVGSFEQRSNVSAVLAVVNFNDLLPDGAVGNFLRGTLQDYSFIRFFCGNHAARVCCDVLRLACPAAGAEPEGVLPPDSPDKHEMRATIRTGSGNPVVVGFFEAFESPAPGLEST